jgi:hypothetical protein
MREIGACPTGEHSVTYPRCGYVVCVDLRVWAKLNRYRFRLEDSYKAESDMHFRGDGRRYVGTLCKNRFIYPFGANILLAHATRGVKPDIAGIGLRVL